MRRLLLLRHAKTEIDAPTGKDFDRRLDDRGRVDAAAIGAWLNTHQPTPDIVHVSTAIRAVETWDLVAAEWTHRPSPVRASHLQQLYGASPAELLAVIRAAARDDPERLMLVGHNPGLHELALALTGEGDPAGRTMLADNMPTAAVAIIDFPIGDWNQVSFRGGQLAGFVSPKWLRDQPIA